jgi:hypothetical protein
MEGSWYSRLGRQDSRHVRYIASRYRRPLPFLTIFGPEPAKTLSRTEDEKLHLQRRRDSPVFRNENIVGSAGGVGVHYLEPDSGVDQRTQRGRGREALPGAGTQQDNFNLQRRQKSDSVKSDVPVRARHPDSFNACGLYDDACLVTLAVDFDVTGPVAGYGVAPVAVCEVEFQ